MMFPLLDGIPMSSGANECAPCPGGYQLNGPRCQRCPAGKYRPVGAASDEKCQSCNLGFTGGINEARTWCQVCPAPDYYIDSGMCKRCSPFTYSFEDGSPNCFYSSDCTRRSSQTAPTKYWNATSNICALCPRGKFGFAFEDKTERCRDCPSGKTTDGPGQTQCKNCPKVGQYTEPGSAECKSCPSGSHAPNGDQCQPCEIGRANNGYCGECPRGTFAPEIGMTRCLKCSGYSTEDRSYCVDKCNEGLTVVSDLLTDLVCATCSRKGAYVNTSTGRCQNCLEGTAAYGGAVDGCPLCPVGKYAYQGYEKCKDCTAGTRERSEL
eukprot:TRINITY_DN10239_c0_g1_i3.p1 TRINITY_DN10239_c0_g1~~TRINITY_DN10239_c0_g1_i3.p1  ORF type:complete len:323 (+),score=-0.30 TRINITY_DN10239_c0_g1_i3:201-1169(+)